MTIGEKIKIQRKRLGLTQTELGKELGIKKNAVSKWECGRVDDIPLSKLKVMSQLFSVRPSYFIDDEYLEWGGMIENNYYRKGDERMPTEKPRITITMSSEQLARIEDYRFGNKIRNQTQAILSLIELGLSDLDGTKITAPSLSDEAVKVGMAYDEAQPGVKFSVRKLLDLEPQTVPAAARGGNLREVEAISKNELPEKDSEIPR